VARPRRTLLLAGVGAATLLRVAGAAAQDLEPRAYSPSPSGTTFMVVSATRSAGGVFTDPSAALTDVDARIGILGLGVGHSFPLLGKSALFLGLVPLTWGEIEGQIGEALRQASRRGLADPRLKLSIILSGSEPMTLAEFVRAPRRPITGLSVTAVPPLGQYDPAKLVNLGSNRWAFKPELGVSVPAGRWTLDGYAGVWIFTDNDRYFPGTAVRHQDPIVALQGHASYAISRRFGWVAADATWYGGGDVTIDGTDAFSPFRNVRLGATWAVPLGPRYSLKAAYSAGAATRVGADFRTITVAWQMRLLGGR
jgi:hypothetical protein